MKRIEITDEEVLKGKRFIDLGEHGDFWVDEAYLDPEDLTFRLVGTWVKMPDEKGNREEVKAEIEGALNPKVFDTSDPWKRELEMTLSDITDVEWVEWDISEI